MFRNILINDHDLQETCLKFKGNKLAHMILGLALKLLQSADASESHMHKKITNENALRLLASTAVASPEDEKVVAEAYCALGNYYRKTGRHNEAELVFEEAFAQGHLLSKWQRFSLLDDFYQPHIVSKPIWNVSESGYEEMFNRLTQNYSIFRQEAVTIFEVFILHQTSERTLITYLKYHRTRRPAIYQTFRRYIVFSVSYNNNNLTSASVTLGRIFFLLSERVPLEASHPFRRRPPD